VKVNLLSPDIYEIEDFVSIEEQEKVLEYCKTLDEAEWWKSDNPEYEKGFFFGKQKLGELPSVFHDINAKVQNIFDDVLHLDPVSLQRHHSGNFMEVHRDYWKKDVDYYIRYGIVIYYNDDYVGGEIHYPSLEISHKPKARSLVMHGGNIPHGTKKVTSDGYRYFSTSFVRGAVDKPVILNQELFGDVEQSDGSEYPNLL
jgi:hypothetical protein